MAAFCKQFWKNNIAIGIAAIRTNVDQETGLEIVPLWIGGAPSQSSTAASFPVFSANKGQDAFLAQSADAETAIKAAESALTAFWDWKKAPAALRRSIVLNFGDTVQARADELVRSQIEETSCSETWPKFNIDYTVNMVSEVAARITTACAGEEPPMANDGTLGMVIREPIGPVLLIAP